MEAKDLRQILGARIRSRRMELGLTQVALAFEFGVKQPYISAIEAGKRGLNTDRIAVLATILETSPSWLLSEIPNKTDAFRANVRQCCHLQGMTQQELAERADLSPQWLSKMLAGKSNPTLPVCERIAFALDVPLEMLLVVPTCEKSLTVDEVANELGVTAARVRQLLSSGELRAQKHGERVWVITQGDLQDYVKTRGQQSSS